MSSVGAAPIAGPANERVPNASETTVKSATRQYFRSITNVAASRQDAKKDFEAVAAAASKLLTWRNGRVTVVTIGAAGGFVFEYHDDGKQQQQRFGASAERDSSSAGHNIFGLDGRSASRHGPDTPDGQGFAAKAKHFDEDIPNKGFETPLSKQHRQYRDQGPPKAPSSARIKYGSRGLSDKAPPKKRFF